LEVPQMRASCLFAGLVLFVSAAAAQSTGSQSPFDECGTITNGGGCILLEGGGGSYVLTGGGGFNFGDEVRVVGTLDTNCNVICGEADGCIRGAEYYDPAVFPCGTDLPNFPGDIITNACSAATLTLLAVAGAGLWFTRKGPR
jgi:hypothetical protein